jgi:putative aldouronate transport system substrate-binding protein
VKIKKAIALILSFVFILCLFGACTSNSPADSAASPGQNDTPSSNDGDSGDGDTPPAGKDPITFTMFVAGPGEAPPETNKIVKKIQELTGVTIEFEFLVGDMEQKVGTMIFGGEYPDFIGAGNARGQFLNAGSFAALDEYLPNYPNLWSHFSPYEKRLRNVSEDGKIYILDIWGRQYRLEDGEDDLYEADYNGPAFWIQKDVLAWDNYSYPKTLEELFDLLERYYAAFPTIDGQPTLPFEILSDGWRSFCLKNAPQHLVGGRNEGDVVMKDYNTFEVEIYQNKDYAKDYYKTLNEAYKKGLINPETFTRLFDQYLNVLSTGRVLCMFDQQWNFQDGENVLVGENKLERTYVPLGISYSGEPVAYNRVRSNGIVGGNGMGISVSCKDIPRAMEFMEQLLSEEIQTLMYWGIEGEDYYVTEDGRYRRTPEQKANFDNPDWRLANAGMVIGDQFPKLEGRFPNGNAVNAGNQPEERLENQFDYDKEFYSHYGFFSKSDFLPTMANPNYPEIWSIFSTMPDDDPTKIVFTQLTELQDRYLPGVIMSDDFEAAWTEYAARYEEIDYQTLETTIQQAVAERYDP